MIRMMHLHKYTRDAFRFIWEAAFPWIIQSVSIPAGNFFFRACGALSFSGIEYVRSASASGNVPVIFAANHISELDGPIITAAIRPWSNLFPVFYVAAEKKFYDHEAFGWRRHLYGGLFFKACGAYPVYRNKKNYEESLANHLSFLRAGYSVIIFPEGGRRNDSNVRQRAHGGVAYLAEATGANIIPVHVRGTDSFSLRALFSGRVRIRVSFGEPCTYESLREHATVYTQLDAYHAVAETVIDRVESLTNTTNCPE